MSRVVHDPILNSAGSALRRSAKREASVLKVASYFCVGWVSVCFVTIQLMDVTQIANAVEPEPVVAKRPFRENAVLPLDSNLLKQFNAVEDILAENRWADAISLLQEIAQSENRSLVLAQPGVADGVATYLNVATRCSVLLSRIPDEGRTVYRRKVDSQAKRWLENWQRTRNEAELLRIVRQAFLSSYGDDALLALGEFAWDRGEFSTARSWWEQMIPIPKAANPKNYPTVLRYPDSDIDRASILARIILCSIMENDSLRAADELQQFSEQFPQAEGRLAGQTGRFVEILQSQLDQSKSWDVKESPAEVATFALSSQRNRRIPESIDIGALRWSRELPTDVMKSPNDKRPFPIEPLCYHPVVYDNMIFINDSNSIRAWNVFGGQPAWKSEGPDPATIYPTVPDDPKKSYESICVGEPHYTMTIADNRLFACMGSPVTCSSTREIVPTSDLVCLDLTREGKLLWKKSAHELLPDPIPWRFEGTPVVIEGRAFMAASRRSPQLEIMIVCLDSKDGQLIWNRTIGSFRVSVDENFNRVSHLLLTAGAGRLFLSTDVGEIIAVNSTDGRPDWAITYESRSQDPNDPLGEPPRGIVPPLFYGGMLFVAPQDGNAAYCIEANSGRVRWKFPYIRNLPNGLPESQRRAGELMQLAGRQWHYLLGIAPGGLMGRLIVSGNGLWSFDIETGTIVWTQTASQFSRKGNSAFGRGLIANDQILIPMRESIEVFDFRTGNRNRSVPLKTIDSAESGGNLTLAGGTLLIAQPNRLVAYGQYSRLKQRIERKVIQKPDDITLQIQLADLDATEGLWNSAITQYEAVLQRVDSNGSESRTVRNILGEIYRKAGTERFRESNFAAALESWLKAVPLVSEVTESVDLRFDLARAEVGLQHPEAALIQLQNVLNDQRLGSIRRDFSTARDAAAREISRLIAEHGRGIYEKIESTAAKELALFAKSVDRPALRRFISQYPQAESTTKARQLLAKLSRDAGEKSEAFAMFDEIRTSASDDRTSVDATLAMIEMLESSGRANSAMPLWNALALHPSATEVSYSGAKQELGKLVQKKSSELESISQNDIRVNFLEKAWSHHLPADCQIFLPAHQPPEESLVLACSKDASREPPWIWTCIDWKTGQVRWKTAESSPIDVVGVTPFHLLIGTNEGWRARAIDNGREVWNRNFSNRSSAILIELPADSNCISVVPASLDVDQGLQLLNPGNGQIVSIMKPPGFLRRLIGHDHRADFVDSIQHGSDVGIAAQLGQNGDSQQSKVFNSSGLYLDVIKPNRLWRIVPPTARQGWLMEEYQNAAITWLSTPFVVNSRLIGISGIRYLIGHRLGTSVDSRQGPWVFKNLPSGTADPVAFAHSGKLLVVADGNQLKSFDASTGNLIWTTGLTDVPMQNPARQICICGDHILATSRGVLQSISLVDGGTRSTQYLGETAVQWRTVKLWNEQQTPASENTSTRASNKRTFVAAWPLQASITDTLPSAIRICDDETGHVLQRIPTDSAPHGIVLNQQGHGILWTEKSLIGLRFSNTAASDLSKRDSVSR